MDWKERLDGHSLQSLLQADKRIVSKEPKQGMREEYNHKRADLILEAVSIKAKYRLFVRQNKANPENFSIGLDYLGNFGEVHLIRFNGAHKRVEDPIDSHFYTFHVHYEAGEEGSMNKLKRIEQTDDYADISSALVYAFERLHIVNAGEYFPGIDQLTIDLE